MKKEGEGSAVGMDRWAEALDWYTTLREADRTQLTSVLGREWQDWYADAGNRRTFDSVSRLLGDRESYRERRRRREVELEQDSYDLSVPIAQWRRACLAREGRKRRSWGGKWWWLSGGGLGVAAVALLWALWLPSLELGGNPDRPLVYQTPVGGLEHVELSDGSSVILGGLTKLTVSYTDRRRSIRLTQGQAWFKVWHDAHWPFVVVAGDRTITDVGTAFVVTRESDRVVVTVTKGVVEVSARPRLPLSAGAVHALDPRPVLSPIRLIRGEQLDYSDNGALSPVRLADAHAATAWTRGQLTFDDQSLRNVVQTIDRYSTRRIDVSPAAGALRFSGIVFDDQIDDWLRSLQVIFPVTVEDRGNEVRIRMRTPLPARG